MVDDTFVFAILFSARWMWAMMMHFAHVISYYTEQLHSEEWLDGETDREGRLTGGDKH